MRKFKFSLQRVLRVKEIREDQQKEKFQEAQQYKQKQQEQLDQMMNEKEKVCSDLKSKCAHPLKVHQLRTYYNYLDRLDDHITHQEQELKKAEDMLEKERQKWIEAQKEKKIMEKLKERKWQDHRQEWFKREQKRLDELNMQNLYDFS